MNTDSRNNRTPVVLLFGPTAVGKTELILSLLAGKAEIINADSVQVYRGMDIGTAKPDPEVTRRIPHHLLDIRNPDEGYSVGEFVRDADALLPDIAARGHLAVVSGGSAFYLRNFIYGLPETPRVDPRIKGELAAECAERGLDALMSELRLVDPAAAARLPASDSYRIVRALEVYRSTGRPLSSFRVPDSPRDRYRFLIVGLERPRDELYRRINARVDEMMARGLRDEVAGLVTDGFGFDATAMKAIGYREFAGYFRGEYPLERAVELIKRNSRRYAKRQITFFRQLPEVRWFTPDSQENIATCIDRF